MSADNTIIILQSKSSVRKHGEYTQNVEPYDVFRVAHVQAWDNFNWYKENQLYNLGMFLVNIFKNSPRFETIEDAMKYATNLLNDIGYVEYGIQIEQIDMFIEGLE